MFDRLQIRMTFYYTMIFILIMLVSDVIIYFFMVNYNQYQMSLEIESMLNSIETQEWVYESEEISQLPLKIVEVNQVIASGILVNEDTEDTEDTEDAEDAEDTEDTEDAEDAEDTEDIEDKDEVEDDASIEEIEDMEEDFSVPNSIYEIVIPKILSTFSVYGILSIDEELVFWKSKDQVNEDELIRNGRKLSVNERPEIIELNTEPEVYYLMSKNEILIKEELLGYYFVGKDVTVAYETMDNLLKILLMSFIVGLFISAFLGYIVAGRSIAPIKKAYESKQDFLANVSHELRTPLSVILLSTETLDGDIDGKETFQHEIVSDIKEETKKMSGLIEKLLLLSRSDSHKLVTTKENFSFTELVEREINNFRALGGSKNIVIEDQLQEGVICFGDKRLLSSVVTVLLDNSIKYNRDNGKVFVLLNNHESKGVKEIELVVRDTGIGIPEKDYEHVFERFYRLENSRSKKTGGYGLGLSIAKEIVELHHGSITLLSKLGEGSEFTVRLPKS